MARLDFKGKQLVWNHHLAVPYHELIPQENLTLTFNHAFAWGKPATGAKPRLVFAPTKYLDQQLLDDYRISFAQLPFEIYEELAR